MAGQMQHHAVDERLAFSETLRRTHADAPTLCGDWSAAQLVAHLVLRERSVLEGAGRLPVASLQRKAASVVDDLARAQSYDRLVETFERGPSWREVQGPVPVAWLFSIPLVREQANLLEYAVHHEDVRRAGGQWTPRELTPAFEAALWKRLHLLARVTLRSAPVGVTLRSTGFDDIRARSVRGAGTVVVSGAPMEVVLFAFGRLPHADVQFSGTPADISALRSADISL